MACEPLPQFPKICSGCVGFGVCSKVSAREPNCVSAMLRNTRAWTACAVLSALSCHRAQRVRKSESTVLESLENPLQRLFRSGQTLLHLLLIVRGRGGEGERGRGGEGERSVLLYLARLVRLFRSPSEWKDTLHLVLHIPSPRGTTSPPSPLEFPSRTNTKSDQERVG